MDAQLSPKATKSWLVEVSQQRIRLTNTDRSRKGLKAAVYAERILAHMQAFAYSQPSQIGNFIQRHKSEIEEVLPGIGSNAYAKKKKEFNQILSYYESILQTSI